MADTTKAAPELVSVCCEFCGMRFKTRVADLCENRVACADCKKRVEWCPLCNGSGCATCGHEGTSQTAECQKTGQAYCDRELGYCAHCEGRYAEAKAEAAEVRADHAREMGWVR